MKKNKKINITFAKNLNIKNMKRNVLKILIILLIFAGSFTACKKENIDIPFSRFSLGETSSWTCHWKEEIWNRNIGKDVIIINSNKELEKYTNCTDAYSHDIDFSKHTLLLVAGTSQNGISEIDVDFFKNTTNRYNLNITIRLTMSLVVPKWYVAIITSKIKKSKNIKLNVKQDFY